MKPLIFLIDSEPQSCRNMRACLERSGYRVREYPSADILPEVEQFRPAVVLIDAALPHNRVLELCRAISRNLQARDTRVILFAHPTSASRYIDDFNAGADDCLIRPILQSELLARIEAVLHRGGGPQPRAESPACAILKLGDMELNLLALRVSVAGDTVPTTFLEFRLLEYMIRNQGRVFTRDQLLDAVWGRERFVTPRSVDACVRRIRNKIEARGRGTSFLKTIRGVGYCLEKSCFSVTDVGSERPNMRLVS
jgi:two-component system phosphate regulon response regulator PhoB